MAEDESISPAMVAPEDESDDVYGGIYHNPNLRNLSRLSVCTSSFTTNESYDLHEENDAREGSGGGYGGYSSLCEGDDEGATEAVRSYFSMLSIENFEADAEFSEEEEEEEEEEGEEGGEGEGLSSLSSCSILGASPREAWRARQGMVASKKEYASEEEVRKDKENMTKKKKKKKKVGMGCDRGGESGSGRWGGQNLNDCGGDGESECSGGASGLMVMTRAKGGKSRLWMDMEEVKACRELGLELELERQRTIEIPFSGSFDTGSSGGNSPITNWRISSPGDDPRDVKARLKVWAQMVALASSSLHSN